MRTPFVLPHSRFMHVGLVTAVIATSFDCILGLHSLSACVLISFQHSCRHHHRYAYNVNVCSSSTAIGRDLMQNHNLVTI